MSSSRKLTALSAGLTLLGGGLVAATVAPAQANPAGTGLVISEVYGGGGNTGAPYSNDYIELYNPTGATISVSGLSVQYRSASGTAAQVTPLSGSVPAGGHYLVQEAAGATVTDKPLPTPDATGTIPMSGSNGVVLLVPSTTAFTTTGNLAAHAGLIDAVGYGTTPTSYETARTGVDLSNAIAASRTAAGADKDHNADDYSELAPTPENSSASSEPAPPPPSASTKTVAEIQGTDAATSPLVGQVVTTQGVVTALYPTGGYNGFYLQTGGTGGGADATPGASDGLFVYGQNVDETTLAIGDSVQVTGTVSEFSGTTQITPATAGDVTDLTTALAPVTPLAASYPATEAAREAHEGELLAPTGPFTVTNTFATNQYAEIGLAVGTRPLIAPTEVEDAQTGDTAGVTADNAARAVTLDDGASVNYLSGTNRDVPLPWLSPESPIRVGASATITGPVVLEFRNSTWKFQPQTRVTGTGASTATFANTRTAAPEDVGGDIRIATFNVLNYFPTTGEEFVASGLGSCSYYTDRAGNRVTVNSCTNNGPRGAADAANLARQQDKIVGAINKLGASIVGLEELENSAKFGKDRDFAIARLVEALNAAAGPGTWAYAPTPPAAERPTVEQEDVIRTGFIYKPAAVRLVGESKILVDEVNFDNAREPLAQAFARVGAPSSDAFAVIVNHFKSKGSGVDDGTGQGNANPDRIGQAAALTDFAAAFATDRGTDEVFLAGDFNSYTMEDPMQVLYDAGYSAVESDTHGEETYSFSGLSGSLDHVLANAAGLAMVTGADIWSINSGESIAYQYSRHNYNVTQFFDGTVPFAASDHDPEIVGLDLAETTADVQILATNDFHGRLLNNTSNGEAGAAVLSGAVKQLRAQNPNTVFAAAGDLIGASTFESFIQRDKPTIDALNEAGLEVSAAGNHEFDAGYDDLVNRVLAPYDAQTNPYGGASWEYIAANVRKKSDHSHALPDSWIRDFGDVEVGFVGAVTEDLPSLVTPSGIETLEVTGIIEETNATADRLRAGGADVIVLLVHEGATGTSYASATDTSTAFGRIVNGVDGDVDAIVSGHTHLAYNHSVPVQEWIAEGRAVTERPVVSAGQYGTNLNKLVFTLDRETGEVLTKTQSVLALKTGQTANYPVDLPTKAIVDAAVSKANELGARRLGDIAGPFNRAKLSNGTTENRGGESTVGNLVAEVQRWATASDVTGAAQIAFMNPGGLRADMVGTGTAYPKVLTYRQAAEVQPFANTLVNMRLTGAQVKTALEQQWQRDANGVVPSRPFLRLGISKGFSYTYDPTLAEGSRVTAMYLDGSRLDPDSTYSVTVNSFLASGGDNFRVFAQGAQVRDTGKSDLQAMVDYMAAHAQTAPLAVDYTQRSVGYRFPTGAPAAYLPGDTVRFDLSSLAFSTAADAKDARVAVSLDGAVLGDFVVDNTVGTAVYDEYGAASVAVVVPVGTAPGAHQLTVTGLTTGTTAHVPVQVAGPAPSTVTGSSSGWAYGSDGTVEVVVTPATATGDVTVLGGDVPLGTATLENGSAIVSIEGDSLAPGTHILTLRYEGDGRYAESTSTVTLTVVQAASTTTATATPDTVKVKKETTQIAVTVRAEGFVPSGDVVVHDGDTLLGRGTLSEGRVTIAVGPWGSAGTKTLVVRYLGDDHTEPSVTSTTVTVTRHR